jgi:hypothetical protein
MPSKLEVKVTGDRHTALRIKKVRNRLGDPKPALEAFARPVARQNRRAFETEGAAIGHPWPSLSPKYAKWKSTHGYNEGTLIRERRLIKDLTQLKKLWVKHLDID